MNTIALWLGYAVLVVGGISVVGLAGALSFEYMMKQLDWAKPFLQWYAEKLKARNERGFPPE